MSEKGDPPAPVLHYHPPQRPAWRRHAGTLRRHAGTARRHAGTWGGLLKATAAGWWEDKAPRLGASLAFYTVLSLAPLLILMAPAADRLFGAERARKQITTQFEQLFGDAGAEAVAQMLLTAPERSSPLSTAISLLVLLFAASGVFAELQDAMDTVWEVTPKPGNKAAFLSLLRQRFLSFAMVLGIGFLLLVSLLVSAALASLRDYAEPHVRVAAFVWTAAHGAVSFAVVTVLFAMIFKVLPDVRLKWRDVWLGAAMTSALFAVGRFVIGEYVARTAIWQSYGTGAKSLVALLVWVYYSAQILFFGAEFTKAYTRWTGTRVTPAEGVVPLTEEARAQQGIPKQEVVEAVAEVVKRREQEQEDEPE